MCFACLCVIGAAKSPPPPLPSLVLRTICFFFFNSTVKRLSSGKMMRLRAGEEVQLRVHRQGWGRECVIG